MKKGFTLIELLVVIAIIGVLSSIVIANVNNSRTRARDAKRKIELREIRNALMIYYDTYGYYPLAKPQSSCGGSDVWASSNGNCGGQWLTADANFYAIMPSVPIDPLNQGTNAGWGDGHYVYSYYHSLGGQDYELVTQLENTNDRSACGNIAAYYHELSRPWCPPWANNMGRSQKILADH